MTEPFTEAEIEQATIEVIESFKHKAEFYKQLIIKYICHVAECEGVSFIDDCILNRYDNESIELFTKTEIEELINLDKNEAQALYMARNA